MSEIMTTQDFVDGRLDTQTLKEVANGDANTQVVSRLGETYPSAAKTMRMLLEQGTLNAEPFPTQAKMQTDISLYEDESYAVVTDDPNPSANGYYQKRGEEWVYLAYNYTGVIYQIITDLAQSLNQSLMQTLPADSEWAFALQSNNGVMGIKKNGDVVLPKPLPDVRQSIASSYNDTAIFKMADKDGKLIFAIGADGHTIGNSNEVGSTYQCRAIKTANNLKIYQKGTGQNYIEYNLDRIVAPLTVGQPYSNVDNWRIKGCYECSSNLARLKPLTTDGAWELALREDGAADFMGTYHGDDITTSVYFIVDDNVYGQTESFDITNFDSLQVIQTGHLYRDNTSTLVADYYREHVYSKQGFDLKQSITWQAVMSIGGYMSMIPIIRNWNDGQITDRGLRINGSTMTVENLTNEGFAEVSTDFGVGASAKIWGTTSGISASLKVLAVSDTLPDPDFQFSPKPIYNKLYWNATGYNNSRQTTAMGEVWATTTQFNVTTKN
tara:strand:+ start:345 stop:1832 length:1488 start_codon:yes stop_codon:yes gene_type:complete